MTYDPTEIKVLDAQQFTVTGQVVYTRPVSLEDADWFLLLLDYSYGGTPGSSDTLVINTQFVGVDDNAYTYIDGALDAISIATSAMPVKKAYPGRALGNFVRFKVTATGTLSSSNYFIATIRIRKKKHTAG